MRMLTLAVALMLAGKLAFASGCPVEVHVHSSGADLVAVSIKNVSTRDVVIPYDFLPWSMFGFGVNFSAEYKNTKQAIQPVFGSGHRLENILLKSNEKLIREINLSKRFHGLTQELGPVAVKWSYNFVEALPKDEYHCADFGGRFEIFGTRQNRVPEP